MTRLFKALAILGMLLCFTLGAFVEFRRHDSPSPWPRLTVNCIGFPPTVPSADSIRFRFGLRSETGEVPYSTRPDLEEIRFAWTDFC
jgi:hypothetical protein